MHITNEIRDKILNSLDIVEVISEAIDLRPKGTNYWALCPFHNEKTPSFSVSPQKGIYKCFGCGAAGNVITFQMEYYHMSYPEAIKELARKAGIFIEEKQYTEAEKAQLSKRETCLKVIRAASEYYSKILNATSGKEASVYLKKRQFNKELIDKFELGFSPDTWDALILELRKQGFSDSVMIDAGLVIEKEDGDIYDRFRSRIMFPIHDHLGNIVGFGGRLIGDEVKQAKYINSPQTEVYDKSKILYGLYQSKDEIRKQGYVILTEGYADVLTLHQAGYGNSVASGGTSLTKEQLNVLYRYCQTLYFVYDADSAGILATERGLELALEHGFNTMIVELPEGEDPDSIIRNLGGRHFHIYLNEAKQFLEFLVDKSKKEGILLNPSQKSTLIRKLLNIIIKIPDKLQHDEYIKQMSLLLNLSERQLDNIYSEKIKIEKKSYKKPKKENTKNSKLTAIAKTPANDEKLNSKKESIKPLQDLIPEEKLLIQLTLSDKNSIKILKEDFNFKPKKLRTETGRKLIKHVFRLSKKYDNIAKGMFEDKKITELEINILSDLVFNDVKFSEKWKEFSNRNEEIDIKRIIKDITLRLELIKIKEKEEKIHQKIVIEKDLNENQLLLLKEKIELSAKRKEIEELLLR
jgi:DNA primase